MREILFRARRIDNGEWVEGYPVKYPSGKVVIFKECGEPPDILLRCEIDPETLCQYTGLNDKNGNRIWENDIVSCEHEKLQEYDPAEMFPFPDAIKYKRNYAVEFINTGGNFGYRLRNKSIHFMLTGNVVYNHNIEIIGNIFDTPELLKGE